MWGKLIPALAIVFGTLLLIYTWKPIVEWNLVIKPNLAKRQATFISPISSFQENVFGQKDENFSISSFDNNDFGQQEENGQFFLTIEKFGIKRAKVVTGDNFKTQLAHFPGTALPGGSGNVVISGHSVLPQFFQPSNYWTIFSRLYLLETGDKVVLEKGWRNYTYEVSDMLVVKPGDTWVVEPPEPFSAYLTLLTCGVGGFDNERIIVRATLQNSQDLI